MAQMTISGVDQATYQGWKELADKYDVSVTTLVRPVLREALADAEEDIPTWVAKDVRWEQLLNENRWRMRVTYFESRVREHIDGAIDSDPMPPPDRLEWSFIESAKDEVVSQAPDEWRDEMAEFVDREMERYRAHYHMAHPEEGVNTRSTGEVVEYAKRLIDHDRHIHAVEYVETLAEEGRLGDDLTPQDIIDQARYKSERTEWDEDISPDLRHTHD